MKKGLVIVLFVLIGSGSAQAWDDICSVAAQAKNFTSLQLSEFSDKKVLHRNFQGAGRVRDVWNGGGMSSKYTVQVDCGNGVLVKLPTSAPRVSENLKRGESISFSGMVTGIYQQRYADTHREYLLVSFNDESKVW
jgi:hypothetical protein